MYINLNEVLSDRVDNGIEHCVGLVFGDGLIFIQCTREMRPYLGTSRLVKGVI
jgi:hypothetical protein